MMAVKESENRKSANHPTRSEAIDMAVLCLYSSISSLSLEDGPWACPPDGTVFFLLMEEDNSLRRRSISAFWSLIVSFSSERAEEEDVSCCCCFLAMMFCCVLLTNANCCDLGNGL